MAKFKFRLTTLLKLRQSLRDERRTHLAQAYRAEDMICRQQARVDDELASLGQRLRQESAPGEIDVDRLLDAQRFEILLEAQRAQLANQHEQVKAEIERRRQALVEANREVQVLEKLREHQLESWRDEQNRLDVKRLDEVAQLRVAREDA